MNGFYALLAQVPFPAGSAATDPLAKEATTNVTGLGSLGAEGTLNGAKAAAGASVSQLKGLWELYTTPNGVYWLTIIKALSPLLIVGFFCWALVSVYKWNTSGRRIFPWDTLLPVIIVIFLFANNGMLLSGLVQAARFLPEKITSVILDTAVTGITGRQMIQATAANNAYKSVLNDKLSQCTDTKTKEACYQNAYKEAQAQANQANRIGVPTPQGNGITDVLAAPFMAVAGGVKLAFIGATIGILTTVSYTSHLFFGLIQVLWASLAPIFTALHLIPNAPNLKVFFSGFIGISLAIIFNSAFQVGTAMLLSTAGDWDPLVLPLLNGLLGVVFSGFIAYLGITGVYATIGTVAGGAAKIIGKK
jgi:uncharacterized integral membrane protein